MRLVHLADPHLGYRAYNRVNPQGLNAREADVFIAFRSALKKTVQLRPDIVLIAGDMFHVVRPSNLTIQHTFLELAKVTQQIDAPIIIIGGNHDSPRSADTGCILDLFANLPGIRVVHSEYIQVKLENLDMSVFCLCHRALPQVSSLKIEPDTTSKYNILLAHGTVEGVMKSSYDQAQLSRSQVISDDWDYIAFGHYHTFTKLADNAYYSGSLEYSSTNIWSEADVKKGFIEYDLDNREMIKFHEVETRDVIDIRKIDAEGLTAEELNTMITNRIKGISGGHVNKIVRLVIENLPRSVQSDMDFAFMRSIRAEALHFELQMRPPATRAADGSRHEPGTVRTLEDEWADFAKTYDIPGGVDRERLTSLGRQYLGKLERTP